MPDNRIPTNQSQLDINTSIQALNTQITALNSLIADLGLVSITPISQADYNALSPTDKLNGVFDIYDAVEPNIDGSKITYDSGSNANGNYIKFADGTMICTKRVEYSGAINTATGALYESANINLGDFPQTFYAIPYVTLSTSIYGFCSGARSTSLGSVGLANILRTTSLSSTTGYIDVIAIGRWKA